MNDSLQLFGYALLAGMGIGWAISAVTDWLLERVKHD